MEVQRSAPLRQKTEKQIKKHPWPALILGIILLGGLGYFVITFSPNLVIQLGPISIPSLIPFFLLLFLGVYSLTAYLMISSPQGIILGAVGVSYLLLRYFGITHPLFGILLLAMLISIEFALYKKK